MKHDDKSRLFHLEIAGQPWDAAVSQNEIDTVHVPILDRIASIWRGTGGRCVVFLAAPPAAGKSTIAAIWEELIRERHPEINAQILPMDGFHFPNKYLDANSVIIDGATVSLRKVKGSPETFNLDALRESIAALSRGDKLSWPYYDRKIHDPVPNAIAVKESGIFIVEGNYLLLDEPGWRLLKRHAHMTVFIEVAERLAKERLMQRYARGGRCGEEALKHIDFSDRRNRLRIMTNRLDADITLEVRPGGSVAISKP